MAAEQTTKCQNHYRREFANIGRCFINLGQAMDMDGGGYNPGLNKAVIATGECYDEIGKLYEEQPRLDWEHIADMMHDYKGLLSGWPQVLQIHTVSYIILMVTFYIYNVIGCCWKEKRSRVQWQ